MQTDEPITAQMTHRSEASVFTVTTNSATFVLHGLLTSVKMAAMFSLAFTVQKMSQKAVLASCCSDVICHQVMWGGALGINFPPISRSQP